MALVAALGTSVAMAHTGATGGSGFASGFLHPLFGPDHVVAMVAVGLWGALLGRPALWLLPLVFPAVMALGGALGILGVPLPAVEIGIAISGIVLGLAVAFAVRPPLALATLVVGAFAVFHGHAHGTELPASVEPLFYAAGFVISTGLLHLGGILLGTLCRFERGESLVRVTGAAIAAAGTYFLVASL